LPPLSSAGRDIRFNWNCIIQPDYDDVTGLILNRFVVGGEDSALLMELPLYHLPIRKSSD